MAEDNSDQNIAQPQDGTQQTADKHCTGWSVNDGGLTATTGRAKNGLADGTWTNESLLKCNAGARLYCFQVD